MADPEKNYIEYYTRIFNYPLEAELKQKRDLDTLGIKTFFCSKCMQLTHREIKECDAMGGFEHKTIFNEDMIMASKMIEDGKAVAHHQADAEVWHWHDCKAIQQLHRISILQCHK